MKPDGKNERDVNLFYFLCFIDWVPIGPRFSNAILQALLVLIKKKPPKVGFDYILFNYIHV